MENKPRAQRSVAPDGCCEQRELSEDHREAGDLCKAILWH